MRTVEADQAESLRTRIPIHHIPNSGKRLNIDSPTKLLDDHRALEPPDPIPNSVVKRCIADGSVGSPHVRVGHRQAPIRNPSLERGWGFFFAPGKTNDPRHGAGSPGGESLATTVPPTACAATSIEDHPGLGGLTLTARQVSLNETKLIEHNALGL